MSNRLERIGFSEILQEEVRMFADIPPMTADKVVHAGQRISQLRVELDLNNFSQYCEQIINLGQEDQDTEKSSKFGELRGLINDLTTSHWEVVKEVVEEQYSDHPDDLRSDFFQIGMMALSTAAFNYNPELEGDSSDPFRSYANKCVSGILTNHFDDLTNPVGITRHYASWAKRYDQLDKMLKTGEISHDIDNPFLTLWLSWLSDPSRQGMTEVISISTEDLESLIYAGEKTLWDKDIGKPTPLGEEIIKKFYLINGAQNAMSVDLLSSGFDEKEYEKLGFHYIERTDGNPRAYEDRLDVDEEWNYIKKILNEESYQVFYRINYLGLKVDEVVEQLGLSTDIVLRRLRIARLRLTVWLGHESTNNQ